MTINPYGFIKMPRRLFWTWLGRDPQAFAIFTYLVMSANIEDGHQPVKRQRVFLKRGQLVTGAGKIAAHLGLHRRTVGRCLDYLAAENTIVQQVSHHGRIITICNFDEYSGRFDGDCPTDVPQSVQQKSHQNGHTERREEERERKKYTPDPLDLAFANEWAAYAKEVSPTVRPDANKWAYTLQLLKERDGVTDQELVDMLAFVKDDAFWRNQAASLEGLRSKSKNGLKKFENILAAMKQRRPTPPPRRKNPIPIVEGREPKPVVSAAEAENRRAKVRELRTMFSGKEARETEGRRK
jgi:hypothetical protein